MEGRTRVIHVAVGVDRWQEPELLDELNSICDMWLGAPCLTHVVMSNMPDETAA